MTVAENIFSKALSASIHASTRRSRFRPRGLGFPLPGHIIHNAESPPALTDAQRERLADLAAPPDETIDTSDMPELSGEAWAAGTRGRFYRPVKQQITARVDTDVLDWLKSRGKGVSGPPERQSAAGNAGLAQADEAGLMASRLGIQFAALFASAIGAACLAISGVWPSAAFAASPRASSSPVVHASREDCEIIIEIGKVKAAWGAAGPDEPFTIDGVQPDGKTYREDCPWADFGVGAPAVATYAPGTRDFGIDRPVYSPDGKTATAGLNFVVINTKEGMAPFASASTCTLVKVKGRWKLQGCTQNFIT